MVWSDLILFAVPIAGSVAWVVTKIPDIIDAVTGDDQAVFERYYVDCRKRGLDYAGMTKEWDVRTVFAKLRTDASNAVAADIANWDVVMNQEIDAAIRANPQHATELKGMLTGLSYAHILYEPETKAVDDLYRDFATRKHRMSEHRRAALTIIG